MVDKNMSESKKWYKALIGTVSIGTTFSILYFWRDLEIVFPSLRAFTIKTDLHFIIIVFTLLPALFYLILNRLLLRPHFKDNLKGAGYTIGATVLIFVALFIYAILTFEFV